MQGETVYGSFTALAESGLPGPNNTVVPTDSTSRVGLSIARAAGGAPVFTAANVDTANGASVSHLTPGTYKATWTLSDANGDTRTVSTRFIEQSALQGPPGPPGPRGRRGRRGPAGPTPTVTCRLLRHGVIQCTVTFRRARSTRGRLQVRIARGSKVVALGRGTVKHGTARIVAADAQARDSRRLEDHAGSVAVAPGDEYPHDGGADAVVAGWQLGLRRRLTLAFAPGPCCAGRGRRLFGAWLVGCACGRPPSPAVYFTMCPAALPAFQVPPNSGVPT